MRFAVIVFPGSNCDTDMFHAIKDGLVPRLNMFGIRKRRWTALTEFYYLVVFRTGIICAQAPLLALLRSWRL